MATLPWKEILKTATVVASLAGSVWNKQGAKSKEVTDPNADVKSQLAALSRRLDDAQALGTEQAKLMQMLAEDLQSLAWRAAIGYWLGIAGLVLAAIALAIVLVRAA